METRKGRQETAIEAQAPLPAAEIEVSGLGDTFQASTGFLALARNPTHSRPPLSSCFGRCCILYFAPCVKDGRGTYSSHVERHILPAARAFSNDTPVAAMPKESSIACTLYLARSRKSVRRYLAAFVFGRQGGPDLLGFLTSSHDQQLQGDPTMKIGL
jgi:hypothetical protein